MALREKVISVLIFFVTHFLYPTKDEKMALTALEIKSITCPEDKSQIKKSDGNGLFFASKKE